MRRAVAFHARSETYRAARRSDINLHYGSEPGSKFYSGLSDQYGYYSILPISPTESEVVYVLDSLFDHGTILEIEELFTDTGGASGRAGQVVAGQPYRVGSQDCRQCTT